MPMTEQEAFQLISLVSDTYNIEFHESKYKAWVSILTKDGDYKSSEKKLRNYIKQSKYKPTLADVLATKPKAFEIKEKPVEETHQYKLEHDPAYKKEYEAVRDKARTFIKELRHND
ncbi:hypothetical protein C7J88_09545 [Staphylococcus muscae]|uniref:Phage protein n=1 Tax=Staphylococcus muscae TaxID=1294 RepID=A0A240C0B9_9STAP|nr:hypothetical protein [Staphylococcus muscae]AVQ34393.1 hypothetical protein C7J88_09545 [Staphylococcus muscae]PNZ01019.1 hypothetical protein CD131_09700 [Staphylococcus muscae]GGA93428.1 hypothetical protein GCM10007183_17060 [Staphylococcus muscae]SNW00596.1 phage protein [Staphylococcus muscae]